MSRLRPSLLIIGLTFAAYAGAQTAVVPPAFTNTTGTSSFLTPLVNTSRTIQLLIGSSMLSNIPVGSEITGFSFRLPANTTNPWPAATTTFSTYNVFLSGSVAPSARSTIFANNVVGPQTQVRSGSLTIDPGAYAVGSSPRPWGPTVELDPWTYNGGNLLLEIRHSGFTGPNAPVDALSTSTPGWGTDFVTVYQSGIDRVNGGLFVNFPVVQLSYNAAPVPEPATLLGLGAGVGLLLKRRGRKRA